MKLHHVVLAVSLATSAFAASATTFAIGTLPIAPLVYSNTKAVTGAFEDLYTFMFPASGATASGSAVSINIDPILSITNIQVSLFTNANSFVASGPVGNSSVVFNTALIPGNSYYYKLTGTATGTGGGTYSFLASAAPVPEPATYALMAMGVGVIGFLANRRRKVQTEA